MKILESYRHFDDIRGSFTGIANFDTWEEINFIETYAGHMRGGHYHRETRELFFILEGVINITISNIDGQVLNSFTAGKGSLFLIEPLEVHTFFCQTSCKWINMLSKRINARFPDIHDASSAGR